MNKMYLFSKSEIEAMPATSQAIFNSHQIELIKAKTPKSEIEIKTDKNGFSYKSVKASYIKKRLSIIFGWNFDFEIKSRQFLVATKEVLVEGRLTIRTNKGTIVRDQFGQHYTSTQTDANESGGTTTHSSDIGNAYKAAATDALKKCASEIGICWDIYGQEHSDMKKDEQPEPDHAEKKILERLHHFMITCETTKEVEKVWGQFSDNNPQSKAATTYYQNHLNRVKES